MSMPSGWYPSGSGAPVAARIDALRSIVIATCAEILPFGSRPGQRRISGTRMPPSQSVPLR
jgi:hypothetical protein